LNVVEKSTIFSPKFVAALIKVPKGEMSIVHKDIDAAVHKKTVHEVWHISKRLQRYTAAV